MAEGKGGRHVVVILSFDKMPEGGEVKASRDEILTMLKSTQPSQIEDAGFAYDKASSAIESAVNALEEHAGKIIKVWKGPDASKARHALQMLHASGGELSTKLEMMSSALRQYASYLPETIAKVEGISTKSSSDGDVPSSEIMVDDAANQKAAKAAADREAQKAMQELNKKIVDLYNVQVPHDVSYELPGVSIPGGTGSYRDPGYPDRVGINAGSSGSGSSGDSGGFDDGSGSGGSGSTGSTGRGTGSDGSRGGGSGDSSGSGSGDQSGSDSGRGDQNGSGDQSGSDSGRGDQNGSDPGGQGDSSSDGNGSQDPSKTGGSDTQDQTVPPVLGQDDKTSSDNFKGTDPNGTEVSSYSPTTPVTTPTTTAISPFGNPVSTIAPNPVGVLSPTGTPSVPSVLGSPNGGMGAGGQGLAAAMRTSGNGMSGGMPFMPMGGAGAGTDQGDFERMTYLPADQDDWNSAHDVTDPVIC
ncbi:WXG100 family type VII secretion target [Nonomuraea guangzhouensis]|uniref:WXG100 family type VII secretion target n=1 Tax=Nonomuraea guangzhouensis TaxID=1291555 RepID=A0ABW4GIW2_9ACTN|nr:WXG100 family type VII secretion target [Nonomuraea guangzhouensis]